MKRSRGSHTPLSRFSKPVAVPTDGLSTRRASETGAQHRGNDGRTDPRLRWNPPENPKKEFDLLRAIQVLAS